MQENVLISSTSFSTHVHPSIHVFNSLFIIFNSLSSSYSEIKRSMLRPIKTQPPSNQFSPSCQQKRFESKLKSLHHFNRRSFAFKPCLTNVKIICCYYLPIHRTEKLKQDCSYQGEALNVPTAF